VVHAIILATHPSISVNKKLGMVVCACHPSCVRIVNRRIVVQVSPGINMKLFEK
jgi:hypothetical protein